MPAVEVHTIRYTLLRRHTSVSLSVLTAHSVPPWTICRSSLATLSQSEPDMQDTFIDMERLTVRLIWRGFCIWQKFWDVLLQCMPQSQC